MRALANDREITATLGVPVRRVEAAAWLGSGLISGVAGLLLSNLVGLDATTLTFLVISSLAAALIARLSSVVVTLRSRRLVVGHRHGLTTPILSISQYRDMAPFVLATLAPPVTRAEGHADLGQGHLAVSVPRPQSASRHAGSDRSPQSGERIRAVVITIFMLLVLLALPSRLSGYWTNVVTQWRSSRSWRSGWAS